MESVIESTLVNTEFVARAGPGEEAADISGVEFEQLGSRGVDIDRFGECEGGPGHRRATLLVERDSCLVGSGITPNVLRVSGRIGNHICGVDVPREVVGLILPAFPALFLALKSVETELLKKSALHVCSYIRVKC